jgi:hypothetical protein
MFHVAQLCQPDTAAVNSCRAELCSPSFIPEMESCADGDVTADLGCLWDMFQATQPQEGMPWSGILLTSLLPWESESVSGNLRRCGGGKEGKDPQ